MNIKEIEERSGMQRANIRYYEQAGLLKPMRMSNGYRDYSEPDLNELMRIKLLRSLDIPIDTIKDLQSGNRRLSDELKRKISDLQKVKSEAEQAKEVCQAICDKDIEYGSLDGKYYLDYEPQIEAGGISQVQNDANTALPRQWKRYVARGLDESFYIIIWGIILQFGFNVNILELHTIWTTLLNIAALLLIEPLLLHFFGTTVGKWIMGIYVETSYGSKPSYIDALLRTFSLLYHGFGLCLPIVSLWCMYKSFKKCRNGELLEWEKDDHPETVYKKIGFQRVILHFSVWAVSFGVLVFVCLTAQMPVNWGKLTPGEFAENFNRLSNHYYMGYFYGKNNDCFNETDGNWIEGRKFPGVVLEGSAGNKEYLGSRIEPRFSYVLENGEIVRLSFEMEDYKSDGAFIYSNIPLIQMVVQAYILAAEDEFFPVKRSFELLELVNVEEPYESYSFTTGNFKISYDIELRGFVDAAGIAVRSDMESDDAYYHCVFTIEKTN